ncbi:cytochrome b5-like [Nymphalis io]|uniref:cytochrome b5-like n=1 Tax=Inachis io TaxID=171585 RepID=UPI002168F316|nr:cytochrome b5-like [Nymphalis io]
MSEVQKYTIADVASRNGRGGAPVWMIYKDSVYDVTSYIPEHPGGDVILEEAGTDATKAFDDVDHSSDAITILKKYKIGEIVEEERKYDANGKKKKRVVAAAPEKDGNRSCMNKITCGLLG